MGQNQIMSVSGYCPQQDCEYEIEVMYLFVSERACPSHIKDTFRCDCSALRGCDYRRTAECPIYEKAQDAI